MPSKIIVIGNPVDGYEFHGPFPGDWEPDEFYTDQFRGDWWLAHLQDPGTEWVDAVETA